jgi:hypothetical protein
MRVTVSGGSACSGDRDLAPQPGVPRLYDRPACDTDLACQKAIPFLRLRRGAALARSNASATQRFWKRRSVATPRRSMVTKLHIFLSIQ